MTDPLHPLLKDAEPIAVGIYPLLNAVKDALESLKVYREILEKMDEEERRQTVLEGDSCENRNAP